MGYLTFSEVFNWIACCLCASSSPLGLNITSHHMPVGSWFC
uniref:Uncharacterized protein n=1 Tax=Rhizophora mucronata TaxID=61149 RepID=A0A2P2PN52_RHIMU